jgi:hypothetical protein
MSESQSHKRTKGHAAGRGGQTEVPLKHGGRLDARRGETATEVERGGPKAQAKAIRRLVRSGAPVKVLRVPQSKLPSAAAAASKARSRIRVTNLSGTKGRTI